MDRNRTVRSSEGPEFFFRTEIDIQFQDLYYENLFDPFKTSQIMLNVLTLVK